MQAYGGLVFGHARSDSKHWYLYVVGGDQDQGEGSKTIRIVRSSEGGCGVELPNK